MHTITVDTLVHHMTTISLLSVGAFVLAMLLTPVYTFLAYRYKFWKRQRTTSTTGEVLQVFTKLHANKFKRNIPTMAGCIGVIAATMITLLFNNHREALLPLAALLGGAVVGLVDDVINIRGKGLGVAGLRSSIKFTAITVLGLVMGWWFFDRIAHATLLHLPFLGSLDIGWFIVPLFAFAVVATSNAVNISDGLDGLAGGLLASSYGAFGIIAVLQGQFVLAGFCFTIIGVLLSYIWFNIYPARFFMGDVGSFAYGASLGVIAMLTNSLLLLPVIGIIFVIEAGSSSIQILSKRFFHRKVFISAPIHHHLEAIGWPETKVTMRFWVIGCIAAFFGILLALAGGHL